MLNFEEYKDDIDKLQEGDQVNVNHKECPSGVDTKRRLYLKRIDGGKVLGYCHHCGSKGLLKGTKVLKSIAALRTPFQEEIAKGWIVPELTYGDASVFYSPPYFQAWLARMGYYEIYPNNPYRAFLKDKVGYNHETKRIYIPYYWKGEIAGYQSRCIDPTVKEKNKWLTTTINQEAPKCSCMTFDNRDSVNQVLNGSGIVAHLIFEDLVSMWVVCNLLMTHDQVIPPMAYYIWCTMGTTMPVQMRTMIHNHVSKGLTLSPIIWYDNDSAGKLGISRINKELGVSGLVQEFPDEPKNMGHYELLSVTSNTLNDYFKTITSSSLEEI